MRGKGKVAVVTGAGTGIGKAAALALLAEGWSVALAGRRAEMLQQAISESGAGERALAVVADVGKKDSVQGSSRRRRKSSAASTSSSTMPAAARRRCRWRTSPSSSGRTSSTRT
jgi:NADP-dependent 3-hydroxy acid dehydrogenase YdfG